MNKKVVHRTDLIDHLAANHDMTKIKAGAALDSILDYIVDTVKNEKELRLLGFGTFTIRKRAQRKGRNPRTGEIINIAANKSPGFKAGKAFKDAINGSSN